MSNLHAMLAKAFGGMGLIAPILGLGVILVVVALAMLLRRPADPLDRLRAEKRIGSGGKSANPMLRRGDKAGKLRKFATFLEPQDEKQLSASRLRMLRAGYRDKNAVRIYHLSQFVLGIGALVCGTAYTFLLPRQGEVELQILVLSTLLPGAIGYYMPIYWVNRQIEARKAEIISGFPDALDLMLVCVEAGQSLDQSIQRVARESRSGYPALAEEFEMVSQEVKAGRERSKVLRDMGERVAVADVSSFVTTLVQSATFGTSISEALRIYAAEMRDKRVMRAEEKANTVPTKLTLGTMLFTLPPLLIILIGPSIYGVATQLGGQ
jgi:tight adherence protein C